MKKWLSLILLGAVSLSLLGCNGGGQKEQYLQLSNAEANAKISPVMNVMTNKKTSDLLCGIDLQVNFVWSAEGDGWYSAVIDQKINDVNISGTAKIRATNSSYETISNITITYKEFSFKSNSKSSLSKDTNGLYQGLVESDMVIKNGQNTEIKDTVLKVSCNIDNLDLENGTGHFKGFYQVNGVTINFDYEVK